MKKIFAYILVSLMLFTFISCRTDSVIEKNPTWSAVGDSTAETPAESYKTGNQDIIDSDKTKESTEYEERISDMYLYINGNKLKVTLAENAAVDALIEILNQGDITYTASDYGGFEKVGSLGHSLPSDNSQITTQSGDVILYSGNQVVLFYGSNTWSYTRLGKIEGYREDELRTLLSAGEGDIQVKISLK